MASLHILLSSIIVLLLVDHIFSQSETQIILDLKDSLKITTSTPGFESWNSTNNVCNYKGIKCDELASITDIDLTNKGVSGSIRFGDLCKLTSLRTLFLGSNGLYGDLTEGIRNCTNLVSLDLAFNRFAGSVPDLSPLKNLQFLNISDNAFAGAFPWDSLTGLAGLRVLSLGDNAFDRTESFPSAVLGLKNLTWLYLSDTNIAGEFPPGIGELTELVNLELSDNFLTGVIPPEIAMLKNLRQLELYNNSLVGEIPVGFGNLSELAYFDASMNYLEGGLSELRGLVNLVSLQLFYNNFSGEFPAEFGEFRYLTNLSLYSNSLSGELPAKLGSWTEFDYIDVSTNFLTGPIPPDMCMKGKMTKLLLLENRFTGEIPASYANCTTLNRFRVSNNSLSGELPAGLWGLPNLNIIDLALNKFEGPIGPEIAGAKSLNQLFLANNNFSGEIPPEIGQATALVNVDISSNGLSGDIPATIGELTNVISLYLSGNDLSGEIPAAIGSLHSIGDLNLAGNRLSGKIPASIGQLTRMYSLDLSNNQLSGEIPASLGSLKLSSLDLCNNDLSGAVPALLSIAAYNESFSGNPHLCVNGNHYTIRSIRPCSVHGPPSNRPQIIATWFIAAIALLLAAVLLAVALRKRFAGADVARDKGLSWDMKSFRVLSFDEQQIIDSVKPENLIGKGGSGEVYKVELPSGEIFAVKQIWNDPVTSGKELSTTAMLGRRRRSAKKEFEAEVQTLSSIRHVNVVNLYCSITCEEWSLLVYEYLPNGSLWERLHTVEGQKLGALEWEARHDIAVGAAKGLEYLHHSCDHLILHRDVKSSNILLDTFYKPRIADFGLAKILQSGSGAKDSTTHVVAGTHGYIAPEYAYTWNVNEKSDVYSFGVVLFELVTGRRPIEMEYGENNDIVDWVAKGLKNRESVMALIDSKIPDWAKEEAVMVLRIGVLCTARLPNSRPTMKAVVGMLEEIGRSRVNPSIGVKDKKLGSDGYENELLK